MMAYSVVCQNNLRQIGTGFNFYFNDNNGNWQAASLLVSNNRAVLWYVPIGAYLGLDWENRNGDAGVFFCPNDKQKNFASYSLNGNHHTATPRVGMDYRNINRVRGHSKRCHVMDGKGNGSEKNGILGYGYRTWGWIIASGAPSIQVANSCSQRHKNAANILYLDMHVAPLNVSKLADEIDHTTRIASHAAWGGFLG